MNIVLLKSKTDKANITTQQNCIIKYANHHGISLDVTEIEGSRVSDILEERKEFKGFLRSLNENDTVLIHDLWVFSSDMGELTKIIECLLKRSINIVICTSSAVICDNSSPLEVMTILSKFREDNLIEKEKLAQGRPKGRMSKSKFDANRTEIVKLLEDGNSVSKISRILEVSRTSLKDYINSRGLKALVEAKRIHLKKRVVLPSKKKTEKKEECTLIKENEGTN
jgi:DNA invertase Pin-like site-specific DNA recombinase